MGQIDTKSRLQVAPHQQMEIFVYLADEGSDAWRPVFAENLGNGRFKILSVPPHEYDPETETWEFLPGETVRGVWMRFQYPNDHRVICAISIDPSQRSEWLPPKFDVEAALVR